MLTVFQGYKHAEKKIWYLCPNNTLLWTTPGKLGLPKANVMLQIPARAPPAASRAHASTWPLSLQVVYLVFLSPPSRPAWQVSPPPQTPVAPSSRTKSISLSLVLSLPEEAQFPCSLARSISDSLGFPQKAHILTFLCLYTCTPHVPLQSDQPLEGACPSCMGA